MHPTQRLQKAGRLYLAAARKQLKGHWADAAEQGQQAMAEGAVAIIGRAWDQITDDEKERVRMTVRAVAMQVMAKETPND